MPANEFEKQVQRRLDDLQLNPSASVWKNVEQQIRNKKRRRVIVFFLLPLALGLFGYSIFYLVQRGRKTEQPGNPVTQRNNNPSLKDINETATPKEQPIQPTTEEKTKPGPVTLTIPGQKSAQPVINNSENTKT